MDNDYNIQELEQLRQQVREFKQRLDRQVIISERILRHSMKAKASWVKNINLGISILGLCLLPLLVIIFRFGLNASWPPIVFFCVMMVLEVAFNFANTRLLQQRHMASRDLITVRQEMLTFQRRETIQMLIEIPLIIVWFCWMAYDIRMANMSGDYSQRMTGVAWFWSILTGGFIGLLFAFVLFLKSKRKIKQIISEIEDYKAEA